MENRTKIHPSTSSGRPHRDMVSLSSHDCDGFTLLEVMIAVAILSGMCLLIYGAMNSILNSKNRVEAQNELLHAVYLSMDKMTQDFEEAFLVSKILKGPQAEYETGFKGGSEKVDFTTFTHFHGIQDARDTDQVSVGYSLKSGRNNSELLRRESDHLSAKFDEGGEEMTLLENVKSFKLEYYDSNKDDWVQEWDSTEISVLNRLPEAVRISLTVLDMRGEDDERKAKEYQFQTVALVHFYKNEISIP